MAPYSAYLEMAWLEVAWLEVAYLEVAYLEEVLVYHRTDRAAYEAEEVHSDPNFGGHREEWIYFEVVHLN